MFIGISPRFMKDEKGTLFLQINTKYLEALIENNLTPLIIPDKNYQEVLPLCHGFLIGGGDDIDPLFYNEQNTSSLGINQKIDLIDQAIINYAFIANKPLLGICRGLQAITVFLGGTLIQDLGILNEKHQEHHLVKRCFETKLTTLLPKEFIVNSAHHQAIKYLPKSLLEVLKCDNIIEAIEHKEKPIIGVQWHPERLNSPESKIIFKYFKEMVDYMNELKKEVLVYNGKIVKLFTNDYLLPNGKIAKREIIKHNGGVGVLTIVDGFVYFVKQYRHAIGKDILEIPAGCIEEGEEPSLSANRELQEEIGFEALDLTFLGKFYPTCGYSSEMIYLYLATKVIKHLAPSDEDEFIEIVKLPLEKVYQMVENAEITDGKTLLALLLYQAKYPNKDGK